MTIWMPRWTVALSISIALCTAPALAEDAEPSLLDILLSNGSITQEQYEQLSERGDPAAGDLQAATASDPPPVSAAGESESETGDRDYLTERIDQAVAELIGDEFPVKASYTSKGFRLETRDGNWQTNLQWRFQFRLTWPTSGDPRDVGDFADTEEVTFQLRRVRMKIGGHGYRPWLKYYFEVDLQPTRGSDDDAPGSSARLIDWRVDVAKYEKIALRAGQWKIDYNRERVDSSGRQQFVERSIVNRVFTIDRQMGVSLRGRLFEGTPADTRYYFGVFTGEGRGVANDDDNMMYAARVQWNFLGRDLELRQTDVERTEKPTASLAFGAAKHTGRCTRWSSGGCGNLDAYASPAAAVDGQYRIYQAVQELAFKYQGLSFQQEFHWKRVRDRSLDVNDAAHDTDLYGLYAQTGYFFNELFDCVPEELELAFRYAFVQEPNATNVLKTNLRQEYTGAANWFFAGHNNKITVDYSYLTLDDDVTPFGNTADHRARVQWDISF